MKWSITKAATEFDTSRETIRRGLVRNGIEVRQGKTYTTAQIFAAIAGDFRFERTRRERATADKLEREELEARGRLVEWERVEQRLLDRVYLPLQQALDAAPDGVSQEWVEKVVKPILRQKVPQPEQEKK